MSSLARHRWLPAAVARAAPVGLPGDADPADQPAQPQRRRHVRRLPDRGRHRPDVRGHDGARQHRPLDPERDDARRLRRPSPSRAATRPRLPLTLAALAALGVATGLINAALVVLLRIPAIIATLATGYMLATLTLLVNREVKSAGTADTLALLANGRLGGVPVAALVGLAVVLLASAVLARLAYGRQVSAIGQNWDAARLAGIRVGSGLTIAFVLSALAGDLHRHAAVGLRGRRLPRDGNALPAAVGRCRGARRHADLRRLRHRGRHRVRRDAARADRRDDADRRPAAGRAGHRSGQSSSSSCSPSPAEGRPAVNSP